MFLSGTDNVVGGDIVVVVCGKICGCLNCVVKLLVKLKQCQIGTKNGVLVDIDPLIMVVVCGSNLW